MRRLLLLLIIAVLGLLTSCSTEKTYKEVTENSELPVSIMKKTQDSSLVMNAVVLETNDNYYVIKQDPNHKPYVESTIRKEYVDAIGLAAIMTVLLVICLILFLSALSHL